MTTNVAKTRVGNFEGDYLSHCVVYRGIPYASPPTGKLRFQPPRPAPPIRGTYDCKKFRPSCLQPPSEVFPQTGPTGMSEDCLYLNIWTPAPDSKGRPVMVWIHGGAFMTGSGAFPFYDGATLVRDDVVVVTINYRLGPFGFLHLPALFGDRAAESSNLGLKDQLAALGWVKEHIADFGGNPENITVFGESAGGMSVGALLAAPSARGFFGKAIAQSGAAHNALPENAAARVAESFSRYFEEITERPSKSLEALMEAPAEAILDATMKMMAAFGDSASATDSHTADRPLPGGPEILLPFQPVVDGIFLPDRPIDAIREGAASGIPLITGTTRDEYMLFTMFDRGFQSLSRDKVIRRIERFVDGAVALQLAGSTAADRPSCDAGQLFDYYEDRLASENRPHEPKHVWAAVATDAMFRVPAIRLADAQSRYAKARMYIFDFESPMAGGAFGSCHALEIPFVFGNLDNPIAKLFCGEGEEVRKLSLEMRSCWTKFASDGVPEGPRLGVWPEYEPDASPARRRLLARFGKTVEVTPDREAEKIHLWDGIL